MGEWANQRMGEWANQRMLERSPDCIGMNFNPDTSGGFCGAIMTSEERVLTAFNFQRPDRAPRFESFWSYPQEWQDRLGPVSDFSDLTIWAPNEGAFCTRERKVREENGWVYRVDSWGRTLRDRPGAYFSEVVEVPIPEGADPDGVEFDPAHLNMRYLRGQSAKQTLESLRGDKEVYCVFGKTGGPFLRTCFIRGEEQFLMDMVEDPSLARVLVEKMADHLIRVAREQLRRWSLQETGVWIYDDMACNRGPMFSPKSFEKILLPAYERMVREYKAAGAKYVALHSDGDVRSILDMLVDAGIDGLHPLERRAGLHPVELRERYPKLVLLGGMCNSDTLVNGPVERVEAEAREIIDLGRNGGVVIGSHSVSPEIPLAMYEAYHNTCVEYGDFCA